jgi:hypothetical protein
VYVLKLLISYLRFVSGYITTGIIKVTDAVFWLIGELFSLLVYAYNNSNNKSYNQTKMDDSGLLVQNRPTNIG